MANCDSHDIRIILITYHMNRSRLCIYKSDFFNDLYILNCSLIADEKFMGDSWGAHSQELLSLTKKSHFS